MPGNCVLKEQMVNKHSNRIHLPKYLCRDLSAMTTVPADKIRGQISNVQLFIIRSEIGNRTVTYAVCFRSTAGQAVSRVGRG